MLHRHQIHAKFGEFIKTFDVVFYLGKIKDVNITNLSNNIFSWIKSKFWLFLHEEFFH